MNTATFDQTYIGYADKVLHALEIALDKGEMNEVDVTALLIEFDNYKNLPELKARVDELIKIYPSLNEIIYQEKVEVSENFDDVVQKYITYLIQNGRAAEVSEVTTKAKTANRSLDELSKLFPEISNL